MGRDIEISDHQTLADAREIVREIAASAGFGVRDLRQILNIVSELGLYAIDRGQNARMSLNGVNCSSRDGVCIVTRIRSDSTELQTPAVGAAGVPLLPLGGMKRLSDEFEISHRSGEITVHALKWRSIQTL